MKQLTEYDLLERFGQKVSHDTCRSLELLKDIEDTLEEQVKLGHGLRSLLNFAMGFEESIASGTYKKIIDSEGKVASTLEKGRVCVLALQKSLVERRRLLRADDRVTHEDGLDEAFSDAIANAVDLHNALNSLKQAIGEHDADLDQDESETFTSVDALLKALAA